MLFLHCGNMSVKCWEVSPSPAAGPGGVYTKLVQDRQLFSAESSDLLMIFPSINITYKGCSAHAYIVTTCMFSQHHGTKTSFSKFHISLTYCIKNHTWKAKFKASAEESLASFLLFLLPHFFDKQKQIWLQNSYKAFHVLNLQVFWISLLPPKIKSSARCLPSHNHYYK